MSLIKRKSIWENIGILALLSVVFLAYSYPLIAHWSTQVIGLDTTDSDTPQIFCNLWWFEQGWKQGNIWHTQEVLYPVGGNTLMHGYLPLMGFMHWLFGGNVFSFINTYVFLSVLLAGLGAFRLAKIWIPGFWGPALVAFLFVFNSFKLAQWQDHYWYVLNFSIP
ncbi:MAG: hypothetical protein LPK45_00850, partial [Bacteroidota bacterium]|nr:hypothetical protein [Bacteroidota bacterium]MDX5429576.1 hypothetical protein [Bacteroidota bacterium]MDX5468360.1 hypothetical protein [Bacteroidota bacterium]